MGIGKSTRPRIKLHKGPNLMGLFKKWKQIRLGWELAHTALNIQKLDSSIEYNQQFDFRREEVEHLKALRYFEMERVRQIYAMAEHLDAPKKSLNPPVQKPQLKPASPQCTIHNWEKGRCTTCGIAR